MMARRTVGASPRVLHVVTDDDRRGAQIFATDLDAALVRRGVASRVVALAPGTMRGLEIDVLGPGRRSAPTIRALRGEMGTADVVVAHGSTTLPVCALAAAGTSARLVYRQISDSTFWATTRSRRARVRAALARYDRVIALYPGAAAVLATRFGVPRSRLDIVPNGVPADRFTPPTAPDRAAFRAALGLTRNELVVTVAAALVPEKGVDLAVRAAARTGATLVVAGDGPERPRLATLARRAHATLRLLGPVRDLRPVYGAADVVCLPTRGGDSMPATLIEAAMCARACVSTVVGGIPDVVDHGVTGLLVAPGDADALAEAFARYRDDRLLAFEHGAAAALVARERFSIDVVADAWWSALRRLAAAEAA